MPDYAPGYQNAPSTQMLGYGPKGTFMVPEAVTA